MEEVPSNMEVVIKNVSSKGIIIRDREEITDKGEEIKTTEYFLDVGEPGDGDEVDDTQFVTVQSEQDGQYVAVEVGDSGQLLIPDKEVILWNEICRVCANSGSDKEFIPIFSGEGVEHDLSSKIETYLPMRVSENDSLPLQVCYNCAATMIAWDEIFKGCMDAQQRLLELQSKLNLKEQYYNDSPVEEENMGTVLEVETTNHEEPQVSTKDALETLQIVESNRCLNLEDGGVITILTTEPTMVSASEIDAATIVTPRRRKRSKRDPQDIDGSKKSKSVNRTGQRRQEIIQAKVIVDGTTYYKCEECPKLLSTPYNYIAHKRVHTHERPCTCEICGKSFTAGSSLNRHVRDVHQKIKDYKCDYCDRRLASKVARDEHQRTHTDERPHVCETCGKSFRQRASLSVHKRFHSKSFLFNCKLCHRGFPRKQDMERHELTHTDQKPYGCKLCDKTFRSSASAIRHRSTHDNDNKHICDMCGECFNQERYLKNHIKKVHKDD